MAHKRRVTKEKSPGREGRLLFYDIENAYLIGGAWEVHETNILEVLQQPYILSIAYRFQDEKKTHVLSIPQFHGYKTKGPWGYLPEQEEAVITAFHKIIAKADFLCAHNGNAFDYKKLGSTFIKYRLEPPKPTQNIDTLLALRRIGKFPSNKLDDICPVLGIGRKLPHTGKHLWTACMKGDKAAWRLMEQYNMHDVDLLTDLYERIKGYIPNHPNRNLIQRRDRRCKVCGSALLTKEGWKAFKGGWKQRYMCQEPNCHSYNYGPLEKQENPPVIYT